MKLSELYEVMTDLLSQNCGAEDWDVAVEIGHDVISRDYVNQVFTIQTKNVCFWCGYLVCKCEEVGDKPTLKVVK